MPTKEQILKLLANNGEQARQVAHSIWEYGTQWSGPMWEICLSHDQTIAFVTKGGHRWSRCLWNVPLGVMGQPS